MIPVVTGHIDWNIKLSRLRPANFAPRLYWDDFPHQPWRLSCGITSELSSVRSIRLPTEDKQ